MKKKSHFAWNSRHLITVVSLPESHFMLLCRRSDTQCKLCVYLRSVSVESKCSLCRKGTFLTHCVYKGYTGVVSLYNPMCFLFSFVLVF